MRKLKLKTGDNLLVAETCIWKYAAVTLQVSRSNQQVTQFLRLAQAKRLHAWLGEAIAERVAEEAGGEK